MTRPKRETASYDADRGMDGVDIDAVHRNWPASRGLFRRQRRVSLRLVLVLCFVAGSMLAYWRM